MLFCMCRAIFERCRNVWSDMYRYECYFVEFSVGHWRICVRYQRVYFLDHWQYLSCHVSLIFLISCNTPNGRNFSLLSSWWYGIVPGLFAILVLCHAICVYFFVCFIVSLVELVFRTTFAGYAVIGLTPKFWFFQVWNRLLMFWFWFMSNKIRMKCY